MTKKIDKPFNVQHEPCGNFGDYPSRSYCSVLHGMREILTANFTDKALLGVHKGYEVSMNVPIILMSLIEELQVYGSRMEAHLTDRKQFEEMKIKAAKLKEEIKELRAKKEELAPGSTECLY